MVAAWHVDAESEDGHLLFAKDTNEKNFDNSYIALVLSSMVVLNSTAVPLIELPWLPAGKRRELLFSTK